jgi:hypothetical protein
METNNEFPLKCKSDYLELSHKISKLRRDNDKIPKDLLINIITAGGLADIPDDEIDALLFDLKTQ